MPDGATSWQYTLAGRGKMVGGQTDQSSLHCSLISIVRRGARLSGQSVSLFQALAIAIREVRAVYAAAIGESEPSIVARKLRSARQHLATIATRPETSTALPPDRTVNPHYV